MHLEPLCRSSTPVARCPQGPAEVGWAGGAGLAGVAWLADRGWQVPGAERLEMRLGRQGGVASVG